MLAKKFGIYILRSGDIYKQSCRKRGQRVLGFPQHFSKQNKLAVEQTFPIPYAVNQINE